MPILGLDPGTRKCGFAVIEKLGAAPLELGITRLEDLESTLGRLFGSYAFATVAIGRGTNAEAIVRAVTGFGIPHVLVDERETTLKARGRFFRDHPPRGWRRLVPLGMLLPDRPIDDYAAVLIAERYLSAVA